VCREDTSSAVFANQRNCKNTDMFIEIDSLSSSDTRLETSSKTHADRIFSGHPGTRTTLPDTNYTPVDSPRNPYSRTPLSVNTLFETPHLDRTESGRWSNAAEISSTSSREKCSSRCSQKSVPASPACTSTSSRSETFEDLCEKHFCQSLAASPPSPTATMFHGSLKNRLLQRAGILSDGLPQNSKNLAELQKTGTQPVEVFAKDLPQSSQVVHVTGMQSDGILVNKSSQNSKDLSEAQTTSTQHNGMYVDSLAQSRQYLSESQSTQAAGSRFPYLVVPSSASQAVYPSLYRPGLAYQEAAATAALFYNQLAAVHHLQQQQQRIFLGTQNQLTVPPSLSHAHSPLDKQNESAGLGRLQRADHAN